MRTYSIDPHTSLLIANSTNHNTIEPCSSIFYDGWNTRQHTHKNPEKSKFNNRPDFLSAHDNNINFVKITIRSEYLRDHNIISRNK